MNLHTLYSYKGISTTPLKEKAAFLPNWQDGEDYSGDLDISYPDNNIGMLTGKKSGIVVLDIDVLDPLIQKKVKKILEKYPTPIMRHGSKSKLPSYFYSANDEPSLRIQAGKETFFELLSDGRQCMIPPSKHPEGHLVTWDKESLLDFDLNFLPPFNMECWNELKKIAAPYQQSASVFSSTESGRNNTLMAHATAKISDRKTPGVAIEELIQFDKENHNPPLFGDPTECTKTGFPYYDATRFYQNIMKSLVSKKLYKEPLPPLSIGEYEHKFKPKERVHFPKHRGVMQEMFNYIYDNSPVPRSKFAWISSIMTMSTLLSNKVTFEGMYTNLYSMIIAPSGGGKNAALKFPIKLLEAADMEHLIGETDVASDNTILMSLEENAEKIDVIDEAAKLFSLTNSTDHYFSKVGDIYAELYTSTGGKFRGKRAMSYVTKQRENGKLGACNNPCVNLFCAMTYRDFENHVNRNNIEKGLMARYLMLAEQDYKDVSFFNKEPIPARLVKLATMVREWADDPNSFDISNNAKELLANKAARKKLQECMDYTNYLRRKHVDDILGPYANRMYENIVKIAMLDHVSKNAEKGLCDITADSIDWSLRANKALYKVASELFTEHVHENSYDKNMTLILNYMGKNGGKLTGKEFCRNISLPSKIRKQAMQDLIESERVKLVVDGRSHTYFLEN
jgi:hypothetical protein